MSRVTHLHVYIVRGSDVTNGRVHFITAEGGFKNMCHTVKLHILVGWIKD